MKKLYIVAVFVLISIGIFFVLRGIKPQPIGVMKPSFFDKPTEIGAVVYRRFYVPLEERKFVVFGIPPQPHWHQEILRGFLEAAQAEKRPFDAILMERQMPPLDVTGLNRMDGTPIEVTALPTNFEDPAELVGRVRELTGQGKRVLLYTASVFSTHLLGGNPLHRYEQATGERVFAITSAMLALRPEQEFLVDPSCLGSERDRAGTSDLGCAILQASRRTYRKRYPQEKFVAMMNQQSQDDYLLMTSYPGQAEDAKAGAKDFRMRAPKAPYQPPSEE